MVESEFTPGWSLNMGLSGIVFLLQFTMIININNIHQSLIFNRKIDDELRLIEMLALLICENSVNFLELNFQDWMNRLKQRKAICTIKNVLNWSFLRWYQYLFNSNAVQWWTHFFSTFPLLNGQSNIWSIGNIHARIMTGRVSSCCWTGARNAAQRQVSGSG